MTDPAPSAQPKKRRRPISAVNLSLKKLLAEGWVADIVERRIHTFVTRDWCGFADLMGLRKSDGVRECLLVQATSDGNVSDRVRKIIAEPRAKAAVEAGATVEVWGWKRGRAEPRIVRVWLTMFAVDTDSGCQ